MSAVVKPVVVRIFGKEYRVSCADEERSALFASAAYLNKKMKEIRDSGKVIGTDRITVMAALNITNELLQRQSYGEYNPESITARISALQQSVEQALDSCGRRVEKPEI